MKSLHRYVREQRILDPSELVLEAKIKNMNDEDWLNSLYGKSSYGSNLRFRYSYDRDSIYVRKSIGTSSDYEIYGIETKELPSWKSKLKTNSGISEIKSRSFGKGYGCVYFKYKASEDQIRAAALKDEETKEAEAAKQFEEEVSKADTSKYTTDDKHITKMKAYFNKRSDPERLVSSIKDDNKLVARWIAAIKINWPEAIFTFATEIEKRKLLTKAELVAYTKKYEEDTEKVDDSDMKRLSKDEKRLSESWITKSVYKWMESLPDVKIEWLEIFKNAKTAGGRDVMRRNGRAWTEGFVVKVTNADGKENEITFDIVTNEGGGLYGYVLDYDIISLKEFKERFERRIK